VILSEKPATFRDHAQAWPRRHAPGAVTASTCAWLAALVGALTIAAVVKPILWDDEVYFQFAQHIARHPLDPYGVQLSGEGMTARGFGALAPPVLLYWWAGAIALLGSNISLTAVALLPFAAIYVVSFSSLARHLVPQLALPVTVMAALSPWAPATISYMLDFPAVALGLAALALFIHAQTRGAWHLVVAAGLVGGLALETKYNAAAAIGAILLWGQLTGRLIAAATAAATAGAVFCAIEALIYLKYGQSHFVYHLGDAAAVSDGIIRAISRARTLAYGQIQNNGPLAVGALLLAPVAFGSRRAVVAANAIFVVLAFALAAIGLDRFLGDLLLGLPPERTPGVLTVSGVLGLVFLAQGARLVVVPARLRTILADRAAQFLLAWWIATVIVYYAMSPFPAARRMGDMIAVGLLFGARMAILADADVARRLLVRFAVAVSAICGSVMLAIVVVDGRNVEATALAATEFMRAHREGENWHAASLGFIRYFDAAGLRHPVFGTTVFQPGDLVAIDVYDPDLVSSFEAAGLRPVATIRAGINLGVSVSTSFYRGANPWYVSADTRLPITVFRAARSTTVPVTHAGRDLERDPEKLQTL
jgi:hypothetical protein